MASAGTCFPDSAFPDSPFWDFSLEVYCRPGVAEACLALQERHGLDVNLLLFCCWAGRRGRALGAADIAGLQEAAGAWQSRAVRPLREARHWLRGREPAFGDLTEALRAAIKEQELDAEHIEQLLLERALPIPPGAASAAAAASNLGAYLASAGAARAGADAANLAVLMRGAFPELAPADAERLAAGA